MDVEADARLAARHGETALVSLEVEDYRTALAAANAALLLESKYREAIVWIPFRDAIADQ